MSTHPSIDTLVELTHRLKHLNRHDTDGLKTWLTSGQFEELKTSLLEHVEDVKCGCTRISVNDREYDVYDHTTTVDLKALLAKEYGVETEHIVISNNGQPLSDIDKLCGCGGQKKFAAHRTK